jgi:hypothetical protein
MLTLLQVPLTDEKNWPLLGMAALALGYIVLRPMLKRKRDPLDRSPSFNSLAQQRAVERQMSSLLVDLNEMARQISSQLDTRAAKLDALIREADERIEQLRAAGVSVPASNPKPAPRAPMRLVPGEHEDSASVPRPPSHDPRHAEVYALADEGRAPSEIAARLNRPNGEIELILALRPRAS